MYGGVQRKVGFIYSVHACPTDDTHFPHQSREIKHCQQHKWTSLMQESLVKVLYFMVMGFYNTMQQSLVWKSHAYPFARKERAHAIALTLQALHISGASMREDRMCSLGRQLGKGSNWLQAPTFLRIYAPGSRSWLLRRCTNAVFFSG